MGKLEKNFLPPSFLSVRGVRIYLYDVYFKGVVHSQRRCEMK
jgi:hypothetical protein